MRGKVEEKPVKIEKTGITPAYAGKSFLPTTRQKFGRDHPRLCGEKPNSPWIDFLSVGSPPPMRGKVAPLGQGVLHFRITPAYAGKRRMKPLASYGTRDHPRLCGEKPILEQSVAIDEGSPPPMRGKAMLYIDQPATFRITPAYAGKSADRQVVIVRQWDHPRLCGEKPALAGATRCISGSPPPMRGKGADTWRALK